MWNPFRRRRLGPNDLSDNLQAVIALTRQEAIRLDNDFIHPTHFLLAVLADKASSLYQLLAAPPADLGPLTTQLENMFKGKRIKQRSIHVTGSLPLTKDFEAAFDASFRLAYELGAKKVEAFHIVLGMLNDSASPMACYIQEIGLSPEMLRALK